jgi:hypothetical protein
LTDAFFVSTITQVSNGEFFIRIFAAFGLIVVLGTIAWYSPIRPRERNRSESMIDPWSKRDSW